MVFAIGIRPELSTQVVVGLVVWVLEIVFAIRRCLPDVEYRVWDALSGQEIENFAVHEGWVTARSGILDNAASEFAERGVG